ncbi:MAG TPA: PQQ-binding-like beta-propeller repeat protein [Gemmatimonadales bacterium]
MPRPRLLAILVGLATATTHASSQDRDEPVWRYDPPGDIYLYQQGPLGNILFGTTETLVSLDLDTGAPRWQRDDLTKLDSWHFAIIPMTTIAVLQTGTALSAIDVVGGETLWNDSILPFETLYGYMPVPAHALLLVYGKTKQSDRTMIALDLGSGTVVWRNDELFDKKPRLDCYQASTGNVGDCPTIRTSWTQVLHGHQKPLADSDTSLVLYLSEDGPLRLQAWTGEVLWRATQLQGKDVPRPWLGYAAWRMRDGVLYVPSERRLVAIDLSTGSTIWSRERQFRAPITQMEFTDFGLVVRGHKYNNGTPKDFFLDLVDPATGPSLWKDDYRDLYNTQRFLIQDDDLFLLHRKEVHRVSLRDGRAERIRLDLREGASAGYMQLVDGSLVISAPQQVLRLGSDGAEPYHVYYEPPKYAWWQNALGSVISGALSVATVSVMESMRDYNTRDFTWTNGQGRPAAAPGGDRMQQYAEVYRTIYQPQIQDRMTATLSGANYAYINTGETDGERKGFNLVRIDLRDGSDAGRLFLGEREPDYRIDPASGIILLRDGGAIAAYRYPTR